MDAAVHDVRVAVAIAVGLADDEPERVSIGEPNARAEHEPKFVAVRVAVAIAVGLADESIRVAVGVAQLEPVGIADREPKREPERQPDVVALGEPDAVRGVHRAPRVRDLLGPVLPPGERQLSGVLREPTQREPERES